MVRNHHDGEQGCLLFTKIQLERTGNQNTWQLFGTFQWKLCRSNGSTGMSEKVFLFSFFRSVFLFFKATLDTSLRFSRPFFSKWNWFVQMVNAIPGRHLLALNFGYHLHKPWTEWYVRVNGKQPKTRIGRRQTRHVTKISSCWVNATSRQGILQLKISFGPIFLLFSYESSRGPRS